VKKIISLFQRNYETDYLVRDEIVPGAEWVANGEGVATRKWDGTCCMIRRLIFYKRYDAKHGKTPPPEFEPAQDADPATGHWPGWLRVPKTDKHYWEAFERLESIPWTERTFELCGPKVNGNPEGLEHHVLIPHGERQFLSACPRTFSELKAWFGDRDIEGVVWHHPDGRMVKIKKKDFGLKRTPSP
jgi:hypothetical protein